MMTCVTNLLAVLSCGAVVFNLRSMNPLKYMPNFLRMIVCGKWVGTSISWSPFLCHQCTDLGERAAISLTFPASVFLGNTLKV